MVGTRNSAGGLAALIDRVMGRPMETLVRGDEGTRPEPLEQWKTTGCRMCGNKAWCTARVKIRDGVVVNVEGDPSNPVSQGKLCSRGQASIFNLYNPYRVKAPMKRTNPRKGLDQDPGWVEIGWEEALTTVAERLKKIRDEDPRKFAHVWGFGGYWWVVQDGAFLPAFGTPNQLRTHGVLCPVHYGCSLVQGAFLDKQDVQYCRYLVTIGGTLGPNIGSAHSTRALAAARERGMKIVVVDPRCGHEASLADEWIPIRPGTDLAFTLAMLNVVMNEIGVFDEEFVKRRTNAVYLIGPDGYYLKDPAGGKPLIWDPIEGRAKSFDDPTIRDYALEGRFSVNGAEGAVAFGLIKDAVKQYTPEWAEKITTVPAATLRRISREFVDAAHIGETIEIDGFQFPFRPAIVKSERGTLGKKGGAYQHLASKMLCMLVGSLDVPGGYLGSITGPVLSPGPDGVVEPKAEAVPIPFKYPPDIDLRQYYPNRHAMPHIAWKAILDPARYGIPYDVEALMIYGGNPITNNANPEQAIAAISKVPFVVTIAYLYDEAAELSDILLPESALMERYGIQKLGDHFVQAVDEPSLRVHGVLLRQPVVKPLHNTRQADDIYVELAERIGFLYGEGGLNDHINRFWELKEPHRLELGRRYSTPEIMDRVLKGKFGVERGLKYFQDSAVFYEMWSKKESYNYYYYPMGTTRHPFYFEHLLRTGDTLRRNLEEHGIAIPGQDMEDVWDYYRPIPRWTGRSDEKTAGQYDLCALNWATPQFRMSCGDQTGNPLLHEVVDRCDPYQFVVLLNRDTAEKKGLRDGDRVVVEAYWGGKARGTLRVTELIHPDAVGIPALHGFRSMHRNPVARRGPHFNSLLSSAEGTFDPVHGGIDRSPRVRVYRAQD
ncbi:MAG: molybdopterin-dependent oxidoreductase [Chloroflexota bacterium]